MAAEHLVVDASVVVKSLLVENGLASFRRYVLHAPTLLWSEVGSALGQLRWRAEISEDEVQVALDRLSAASIEAHHSDSLIRPAIAFARQAGWARTYDAEYVVLAQDLGASFMTLDSRLARAVVSVVNLVEPLALD